MSKLIVKSIKRKEVFGTDFAEMTKNNEIEFRKFNKKWFPKQGIAVLYGPNGTGKTSLARVFSGEEDSSFELDINGTSYTNEDKVFHVIDDQNSRNIIKGKTEEFLLGDNIAKEYELKESIELGFRSLYKDTLQNNFKKEYGITKIGAATIDLVVDEELRGFIRSIVNKKSSGEDIDRTKFVEKITNLKHKETYEQGTSVEEKVNFIFNNYTDQKSLIATLLSIDSSKLVKNTEISQVEENTDALKILSKFNYKTDCVVCDNNDFQREKLIEKKKANKERVLNSLNPEIKTILEKVINVIDQLGRDPFEIKKLLLETIEEGELESYDELISEIKRVSVIAGNVLSNTFANCVPEDLATNLTEYNKLLKKQPKVDEADVLLIQNIVSENIGKDIVLTRDTENDNNFKIMLGEKPLLGEDRKNLELSNGEQNFISLSFELLKAKNVDQDYVLLDDPISSFDSIYKNKIAFCILKFLENKKQIIMTHNTDLIRLLQYQMKDCFNLYLFNNTDGEENGFIPVNSEEISLLLDMSKLTDLLREGINTEIENEKLFLLSTIPFMRGYANITGKKDIYSSLSKVMHGYETEVIDIAAVYRSLFGEKIIFFDDHKYSAEEICNLDLNEIQILEEGCQLPLLNKTLTHTLTYLYLRMTVEKRLMSLKGITLKDDKYLMLTDIIKKAFHSNADKQHRVFFTSRKTLLNEFNHFEGNLNIFQPAIDITDTALIKERLKIENYLNELEVAVQV